MGVSSVVRQGWSSPRSTDTTSSATHNTVTSLFWLLVDIYKDPDALRTVREEADACFLEERADGVPVFDVARLVRQPYLQAAYAETLRLRTHGVIVRYPRQAIRIRKWHVPADCYVATSSTTAHMNPEVWSSAERGSHPVDVFAPRRFLVPDDQGSGTKFSLSGLEGSWIPFGGGIWACPGRMFAKQQTILMLAAFAKLFDIEVLASNADLEMSPQRFGFGVLEPKGKIPFRVTPRAAVAP